MLVATGIANLAFRRMWNLETLRSLGQWPVVAGAPVSALGIAIFVAIAWRLTGASAAVELRPPD